MCRFALANVRFRLLGDGAARLVQVAAITRMGRTFIFHHVADASLMRIQPRQQAGPRRAASGGIVKLREPHTVLGEFIQVRGGDFTAVTAEVGEAHVVAEDDDHVRPFSDPFGEHGSAGGGERREGEKACHG